MQQQLQHFKTLIHSCRTGKRRRLRCTFEAKKVPGGHASPCRALVAHRRGLWCNAGHGPAARSDTLRVEEAVERPAVPASASGTHGIPPFYRPCTGPLSLAPSAITINFYSYKNYNLYFFPYCSHNL